MRREYPEESTVERMLENSIEDNINIEGNLDKRRSTKTPVISKLFWQHRVYIEDAEPVGDDI